MPCFILHILFSNVILLYFRIGHTNIKGVDEFGKSVNQVDYLCKWVGLPYAEASWEDGPLISKIGFQEKIDSYLKRERCDKVPGKNERFPKQKPKFIHLKKQPAFLCKGTEMELRDYQLGGLNFLTHSWSRVIYLFFKYYIRFSKLLGLDQFSSSTRI